MPYALSLAHRRNTPITFFITDQSRIDAFLVIPKLPRNSVVIFRDYEALERLKLGLEIKKICREYNIPFLVAKDFRLAVKLQADGMHLPEFKISAARRIKRYNKNWIITTACHSRKAIIKAKNFGADFFIVSPLFNTGEKNNIKIGMGITKARNITKYYKNCVVLGGISSKNHNLVRTGGFSGFAGVSEVV